MSTATKILVVDDSRTVRQQVASVLTPAGFDVLEAEDGRDGLARLEHSPETKLVICDLHMPVMNGLEMLVSAKGNERWPGLRFLMLTTEAQPSLVQQAKNGGASGWIIKPFKPELLLAAVRKLAK